MKLSELTSKPKLVELHIDDEATIKEYGEKITFYSYDRQPMDVFIRLANINDKSTGDMIDVVKKLILDENGKPLLDNDNMLPTVVLMKAIGKVVEQLGK